MMINKKQIFTFWEPREKMPVYIKQCIETWKEFLPDYQINIIDYSNLRDWLPENYYDKYLFKNFSLPIQADAIRCALLNEYGGIWLDADTIITSDNIQKLVNNTSNFTLIGDSIGFIVANKNSYILKKWQQYVFKKIAIHKKYRNFLTYIFNYKFYRKFKAWDYLGNSILNHYISKTNSSEFCSIPIKENYIMPEKNYKEENNLNLSKVQNYKNFYFYNDYSDYVMKNTCGIICLHNSWTPKEFVNKDFSNANNTITQIFRKINRSNPCVSVIIPIYNVEKYLGKCLESVVNQTLRNIEIICINDGSTDNSLNVLNKYAENDNRIKVINKENSGYGISMNMGMEIATGEYIAIIEPDDFVKLTMFEDLYKSAKKLEADIAKADYFYFSTANNIARKAGKIPFYKANKITNVKKDNSLLKMAPAIWSGIYKKQFLHKNNIKFLETPGASYQDTSFSFKVLALAQRIVLLNSAYVYYRQDNENSSSNQKNKVFILCEEFQEITNFLNQNVEIKKYTNSQKLVKQYKSYMWNLKRIAEQHQKAFIDVFSETFKSFYNNGEITSEFYRKIKKSELLLLINNKEEFKNYLDNLIKKEVAQAKRKKIFSIRINFSRISIILLGKKIVEIG